MTANEMTPAIGATVELSADGLYVACTVADVKFSWGKPRLLVRPIAGRGERWVELSSLAYIYPSAFETEYRQPRKLGA